MLFNIHYDATSVTICPDQSGKQRKSSLGFKQIEISSEKDTEWAIRSLCRCGHRNPEKAARAMLSMALSGKAESFEHYHS